MGPFTGLFAFVVYFWFIASTGHIFAKRPARPVMRSQPVHMYSPLSGRQDEQENEEVPEKGMRDCLSIVGVVAPLLLAVVASGFLVYHFVVAMRVPMHAKCAGLIN